MAEAEIETFKFTKEVPCVDADGKPIKEGSVLVNIKDGERGIVISIGRPGQYYSIPLFSVGDVAIQRSPGSTRVTNKYGDWKHVPHNEQTYDERMQHWLWEKYDHDEFRGISREEGLAIAGIMALLPDDTVDWDWGPWPDKIEDALNFLVEHMNKLKNKEIKND